MIKKIIIFSFLLGHIYSSEYEHSLHLSANDFNVIWLIPFIGILLSIAILPIIVPSFWHSNYGKVSLFWGFLFISLFIYNFGPNITLFYLLEVYLKEFIPFIVILLALYTVSGGIVISGNMAGTPIFNTALLTIGTILSSWMGTTGASMLLIRPLIRANKDREKKVHIFVFFIFLVSNIGGALTPLGDPPLFLGFLKGVDFFWTTTHLFLPMLLIACPMLIIFYLFDKYYYDKQKKLINNDNFKILLSGKRNLILIILIILSVIFSGIWKSDSNNIENWFISYGNECIMTYGSFIQVLLLLSITFISLKITPQKFRHDNDFSWEPIKEVSKLFATIFITMIPAITMLKSGLNGPLKGIIALLKDDDGNNINMMYFWITGILSAFLDNAPTYLVFFNTAGGNASELMSNESMTLIAISAGAVFMGALSYIGNAPNFMVKSIAEENNIKMPSFFGYMLWSVVLLIPILVIFSFIYF